MFNSVFGVMAKKVAKTAASTVLEGLSFMSDKVAEYSDEAQEWI